MKLPTIKQVSSFKSYEKKKNSGSQLNVAQLRSLKELHSPETVPETDLDTAFTVHFDFNFEDPKDLKFRLGITTWRLLKVLGRDEDIRTLHREDATYKCLFQGFLLLLLLLLLLRLLLLLSVLLPPSFLYFWLVSVISADSFMESSWHFF